MKWAKMLRILGWEGGNMQLLGAFFKAVVQKVLLFVSDTWVITPHTGRGLGGVPSKGGPKEHGKSSMEASERKLGVPPLWRRQCGRQIWRVAQYISARPIMDLYEEAVNRTGTWVSKRWWKQKGLDLEVASAEL